MSVRFHLPGSARRPPVEARVARAQDRYVGLVWLAVLTAACSCSAGSGSNERATDAGADAISIDGAMDATKGGDETNDAQPDVATSDALPSGLPPPAFSCTPPTVSPVSPAPAMASTVQADASSSTAGANNHARTFAMGSTLELTITAATPAGDTLAYEVDDADGTSLLHGTTMVPTGTTRITLACASTMAGYFALHASLQTSGVTLPQVGTRPQGIATFGVLPDFTWLLTPVAYAELEEHRFGLQGTNALASNDWLQPINANLGATWTNQGWSLENLEPDAANTFIPDLAPAISSLSHDRLLPYYTVNGFPAWASSTHALDSAPLHPPNDLVYYQDFMTRVGKQAAAQRTASFPALAHDYFQPTWEPGAWAGSAGDMVNLYKSAYQGLHAGDPSAVVVGITTCCVDYQEQAFDAYGAAGLWSWLDGLSMHGYLPVDVVELGQGPDDTDLVARMRGLRSQMVQHLPAHAKLISSETGFGYPKAPTFPSSSTAPTTSARTVSERTLI